MCGENIVGEGIYGERQLLSAGDDFFFAVGLLKLQFQSGTPPLLNSLDLPLFIHTLKLEMTVLVEYFECKCMPY